MEIGLFPAGEPLVFLKDIKIHVVAHVAFGCLLQRLIVPRIIAAVPQCLIDDPAASLRMADISVKLGQIPARLRFRAQLGQRALVCGHLSQIVPLMRVCLKIK